MNGLLTTAEVAKRWGCTQQWVQALCKRGLLKAELMGNTYVVRERDADAYEHRSPGRPSTNGTRKPKTAKKHSRAKRRTTR
jgi:excisionase family DNA binding protein